MPHPHPFLFVTLLFVVCISPKIAPAQWSLSGNSGTTPGTNFLGTKDAKDLIFKTNNIERLRIYGSTTGGLKVGDPINNYILQGNKSGTGGAINVQATSSSNSSATIYARNAGTGIGISGNSVSGIGVRGASTNSYAVYGQSTNSANTGIGVYGSGYYGMQAIGNIYGLYATANKGGYGIYSTGGYYGMLSYGAGYGVYGYGTNESSHGVHGYSGGPSGCGVFGESSYDGVKGIGKFGVDGTGTAVGVIGYSSAGFGLEGIGDLGLYAQSDDTSGFGIQTIATNTYGVGLAAYSNKDFGLYATTRNSSSYAGYFDGNIYCTGTYLGSDLKLKKNIKNVDSALDIINKLQPKSYEFRNDGSFAKMSMPGGSHYGLIAQEVEKVLPNLVKQTQFDVGRMSAPKDLKPWRIDTNDKALPVSSSLKEVKSEVIDFKAVNYTELIPLLVKAVQELSIKDMEHSKKEAALTAENAVLKDQLNLLTAGKNNELTLNTALLAQNSPNPFYGSTVISYNLPEKFSKAQIIINDQSGKSLKQVTVSGLGRGTLTIDAKTLSSGAYSYSLVIDGKVVGTKQMVVAK